MSIAEELLKEYINTYKMYDSGKITMGEWMVFEEKFREKIFYLLKAKP